MNVTYPEHCQRNAASHHHPSCVPCGVVPSPLTCILAGRALYPVQL